MKAAKLARCFDGKLDRLGVSSEIPRVIFLPCCVYYEYRNDETHEEKAFLCESRLDPNIYMKWNDNAGAVDGIGRENLRAVEVFWERERKLEEGDEEEDRGEDIQGKDLGPIASEFVRQLEGEVLEADVPQAFLHTDRHTKRTMLGSPGRAQG
eukprot:gene4645-5087_t